MTPRDHIGNTYVLKRADALRIGDRMLLLNIGTGLYDTSVVISLELVGDDVEVNQHVSGERSFCTSMGNAVLVQQ